MFYPANLVLEITEKRGVGSDEGHSGCNSDSAVKGDSGGANGEGSNTRKLLSRAEAAESEVAELKIVVSELRRRLASTEVDDTETS